MALMSLKILDSYLLEVTIVKLFYISLYLEHHFLFVVQILVSNSTLKDGCAAWKVFAWNAI